MRHGSGNAPNMALKGNTARPMAAPTFVSNVACSGHLNAAFGCHSGSLTLCYAPRKNRWAGGMISTLFAAILFFAVVLACTSMYTSASSVTARDQVWAAELAFARTMADRNLGRFSEFIAEEAVFFAGTTAVHGKSKVVESWAQFFAGPDAPFSWEPDQVEVLKSGGLALSTGPVRDPTGKVVARFNSIWRLEASGQWRVIFDKGCPPSPGPK